MTEEDYCSQCGYFPPHCECKDYISIRDMKAKKSHIVRHQTKQIKQLKQQLAEKEQENQQLKALLEYLKEQTEHCRDYECGLMTTELVLDILSEDKEVILEQLLKGKSDE